jgi:hypothetical protein
MRQMTLKKHGELKMAYTMQDYANEQNRAQSPIGGPSTYQQPAQRSPYPQRPQQPTIPSYSPYPSADNTINALQQQVAPAWDDQYRRQNARTQQGAAQDYARQAVDHQTQLQNRANKQIEGRQQTAEGLFAGLTEQYQNDPLFGQMRSQITNWMNNPGLSRNVQNRLAAQTQARSAADLASRQRGIDRSASRFGLRGAQTEDSRQAARSRSNAGLSRNLLDLDLQNERMKQSGRAQAIGAAGNLAGQYYGGLRGLSGAYSNLLTSYNPQVAPLNVYDAMQNVYANPYYGTSQSQGQQPYAPQGAAVAPQNAPAANNPANWGYITGPQGTYSIGDGGIQQGLPENAPPPGNPAADFMYQEALQRRGA